VSEGFTRLFDKGLIYRANRLVNWSCALKTAISDIEVEFEDLEKATMIAVPGYDKKVEFGVLNYFAYQIKDTNPPQELIIATTRIETMLGDVAISVNPKDDRYK
jgi:valyl-tRNA synthetase